MKLARERRLGATDAAKLLGVSKYGGPIDVYNRVVLGKDVKVNKQMKRGVKCEPEVRRRFVEETGFELQKFVMPLIVAHEEYHWATCSPDDITTGNILCEYKTVSRWGANAWLPVPIDYVLQVQWSLWVTGCSEARLYAAFGDDAGDDFHISDCKLYEFRPDLELQREFIEVGEAFWNDHIIKQIPPTETVK